MLIEAPEPEADKAERFRHLLTRIDSALNGGGNLDGLLTELNSLADQQFDVDTIACSFSSQSIEELAAELATPPPRHISDVSRDDLIAVVRKILEPDTSERERFWYLDFMGRNTPHPAVSDLIYWPGHDDEVLAEDVVDQALAYTPIVLAPPGTTTGEQDGGGQAATRSESK
jgi:hypothetical protein